MRSKFTGEICVMKMMNYAKSEEELTCQFKIDTRNLSKCDLSPQKSQNFPFIGLRLTKVYNA